MALPQAKRLRALEDTYAKLPLRLLA